MKLGLFSINSGFMAIDPSCAVRVAIAAEQAGWESVWTGEHYLLPDPVTPASPAGPTTPILDPFVALSLIAGHTTSLRLGTGITVVPLHHPAMLAKKVVSLDRVSAGRFEFGVGVGYLAEEFAMFGVPLSERAARLDNGLETMAQIWTGERVAHRPGMAAVMARPTPVHVSGPRVHFGGHVDATFRRVAERGHGWFGWSLDPERASACIEQLRSVAARVDRPGDLGDIEISVAPPTGLVIDTDVLDRYARLGVHRLIVVPPHIAFRDEPSMHRFVEQTASLLRP